MHDNFTPYNVILSSSGVGIYNITSFIHLSNIDAIMKLVKDYQTRMIQEPRFDIFGAPIGL